MSSHTKLQEGVGCIKSSPRKIKWVWGHFKMKKVHGGELQPPGCHAVYHICTWLPCSILHMYMVAMQYPTYVHGCHAVNYIWLPFSRLHMYMVAMQYTTYSCHSVYYICTWLPCSILHMVAIQYTTYVHGCYSVYYLCTRLPYSIPHTIYPWINTGF